jgi:hypothetical protein
MISTQSNRQPGAWSVTIVTPVPFCNVPIKPNY